MKRKLVISSYNASLDWVERTHAHGYGPENTIIYNKGDDGKDWSHLGQVIKPVSYTHLTLPTILRV